jgi:hypothetical protein
MPCSKGTRYHHVAYLSIDEYFSKCSSDYGLAPNLEPHPSNADFKAALMRLSEESGISRCMIPVVEFEDAERELEPYSDRVFVAGSVVETVIAAWARELRAEFYREARPGAEIPREHSNDQPGWFLVWD